MRLPGIEPGSIMRRVRILTVGLQLLNVISPNNFEVQTIRVSKRETFNTFNVYLELLRYFYAKFVKFL